MHDSREDEENIAARKQSIGRRPKDLVDRKPRVPQQRKIDRNKSTGGDDQDLPLHGVSTDQDLSQKQSDQARSVRRDSIYADRDDIMVKMTKSLRLPGLSHGCVC